MRLNLSLVFIFIWIITHLEYLCIDIWKLKMKCNKGLHNCFEGVVCDLFQQACFVSSETLLSLALTLLLHRSPLWLPVPFVIAAGIAHSHWSSYHSAIFHISHIRSPYLSSSAWARHANLIQPPSTCTEFSDCGSQWCEIHIDFISYFVLACNGIQLILFPITVEITWSTRC